jgi:hypothetical protein
VPPLVGVAVNVILVPGHTDPDGTAAIATEGVTLVFTTIVTVFELAVAGDAQVSAEVITQKTVFPFAKAALEYVAELVPTLEPLSFH